MFEGSSVLVNFAMHQIHEEIRWTVSVFDFVACGGQEEDDCSTLPVFFSSNRSFTETATAGNAILKFCQEAAKINCWAECAGEIRERGGKGNLTTEKGKARNCVG